MGQTNDGESSQINNTSTGGGASVGRDVNTGGGDFVGHDKNVYGDEVAGDKFTGDKYVYNAAPPAEPSFPISNLPPVNPHFTGRTAHLQSLAQTLTGETTAITQTIAGLGGVGKSQLMLQFAHQHRQRYDITWWLRVDEALAEDLLALGRQLHLPVETMEQPAAVQLVRNWLSGSDKRWLLLCDNADQTEPRTLRQHLPGGRNGRILITSRSRNWRGLGQVLPLDVFSEQEAADFWQERLDQASGAGSGAGSGAARLAELAHELGRLPLALELPAQLRAEYWWRFLLPHKWLATVPEPGC
jgi:hypothetical protein